MASWIENTALPITAPLPYGAFHITIALIGVLSACFLAWKLKDFRRQDFHRILFLCGLVLAVSEVYKQFSLRCGITAGIMLYLISICIGGLICHTVMDFVTNQEQKGDTLS